MHQPTHMRPHKEGGLASRTARKWRRLREAVASLLLGCIWLLALTSLGDSLCLADVLTVLSPSDEHLPRLKDRDETVRDGIPPPSLFPYYHTSIFF